METPLTQYPFCADINLHLYVVNTGATQALVPFVDETTRRELKLVVRNDSDSALEYEGLSDPIQAEPVHLAPGDTTVFSINIVDGYGREAHGRTYPMSIPTGLYQVSGTFLKDFPLRPVTFEVTPLTKDEEVMLAKFTKEWYAPADGDRNLRRSREIFRAYSGSPFCALFGRLVFDEQSSQKVFAEELPLDATLVLDNCPNGFATVMAFSILLRSGGDNVFRKTMSEHASVLKNTYARLCLKEVLRHHKKMYLYDEVIKDVANSH